MVMRFVRAAREADWPLLIQTLKQMLPYFAAAEHWHYLRYLQVHLIKMTKMPRKLLQTFIDGDYGMHHASELHLECDMVRHDD